MSVIVIQKKVICDSTERQIILEPQEQDILFEEDLVLLYRFHYDANDGGIKITTPFVEQRPEDTVEWAAVKEYYNSWAIPHILLYLFVFGQEVDDDAPRQTLALPNYGVPFPLPLNNPIRLKAGQGLAIELVNNGYDFPDSNRLDNFITIYGDAWLGRNEFNAQTVNVDATSQTTVNAAVQEGTPPEIDLSQLRKVGMGDISSIKVKFRMPSGSTGVALYEPSPTMNNAILFDDDEVGLWQPVANNVRGNNSDLDIFTTLRSCGHVIEVEFNQTLTIGQINIVTPDFPDKAMGNIRATEDYRGWKQIHTGYLSGNISLPKPERARKIEIVAPLEDNLVDGVFKIYEINLWVAEEILEVNNDPLIIQQATFRLNPEKVNTSSLETYESFTLADGSTAPLVKTEDNRKYIEWRFTGNNDKKQLVSSEQFVVKSLLIELRSPTTSWEVDGSFDNANGGMITGLNPQSSPLFTALGGTSSINWYTAYKKISRNNITLTGDNVRGVDLSPIDNWFWVYIELNESFTDQLMLGLGSYSWHRVDVDVRQILTYDSSLSERNINDVIAYFGTSPSPTPTPVPVPTPTPSEPSAYLDSNNIILKPDTLADGNLSNWGGYVQRGSTQPTVTSHGNYKLVSFSGYSELAKSLSSKANFYGVTCIIKSPNPSWNNWGNVWSHNVPNHSWTFALDKDGTAIGNNPPLSRVRVNKSEINLISNWELGTITNLFCLTIFWDASMITHSSGDLVIHKSSISDWQCEYSLGDVLVWGNMPSDADLIGVEDWMMDKYSIL